MDASRKRQKVTSACERCRKRKRGCDFERPCQACVRASAECVPRNPDAPERAPSTSKGPAAAMEGAHRGSDWSNVASSRSQGSSSNLMLPESSIVDLTALVLSKMRLGSTLGQDTFALPGGDKIFSWGSLGRRHWRQIVGLQLPDDATLGQFVDRFFVSVDWFMMLLDDSLFRERYSQLLQSNHVASFEENFLWLSMLVVALGAHYTSLCQAPGQFQSEIKKTAADIMRQVEARCLGFTGCASLEAVQVAILLGSFLLFNGRPNASLAILAVGVKTAQVINLHLEYLWPDCSVLERETRRRTWWALEVFDKYSAVAFGRPCILDDSDCSVRMITRVGPALDSIAKVNINLQFHQRKFQLYRIMGQFLGRRRQMNRAATLQSIHAKLIRWKEQLPNQLRIESYRDAQPGQEVSIPQMQAVTLELTYENLQLTLHRSAVFGQGISLQTTPQGLFSLKHLVASALRTSNLHRFPNVLYVMQRTHANMHITLTLFTAGIVLCIVCLSQPLTSTGQMAKSGVMHIIQACKDSASPENLGSRQIIAVLEHLFIVLLQHESQLITGSVAATLPVSPASTGISTTNQQQVDISQSGQHPGPATTTPGATLARLNWDGSISAMMYADLADASQV